VINANEFSVIDKDGQVDHVYDMGNLAGGYPNNPFRNHELLLEKISSPQDLIRIPRPTLMTCVIQNCISNLNPP